MATSGIKTLDHAPNVAGEWLSSVQDAAALPDIQQAYMLLRATLHAVRDWLSVDEAAQLSAQLPILVRGIYFEGWNPSSTPVHPRHKGAFLQRINAEFTHKPLPDDEAAVSAVFALLKDHISPGEIDDVVRAMPKDLRQLWP